MSRRRNGAGSIPNRSIRVPDELWSDYDAVCAGEGVTRNDDLCSYMRWKVRGRGRPKLPTTVDRDCGVPLYMQLADVIRSQIERGELIPGQTLPAETDYMQEHGISRAPVRRAVALLCREGLIVTTSRGPAVRGGGGTRASVPVEHGRITAPVHTPERQRTGIGEGVAVIVVERDGHDPAIYPADRAFITIRID